VGFETAVIAGACSRIPAMKVCRFGEVELVVLVVEGVLAVLEQREVRVHARAVDARDRFGHERRVEVVLCGDGADDGAEGADVVRRRERVVVFEVDLVLAPGNLVVARFDLEAHILEAVDDVTSNVAREVFRCEVEIAAVVARLRRCTSLLVFFEEEELRFGCRVDPCIPGRRRARGRS